MELDKVIKLLKSEYERAQKSPYVKKPLAWALYQVWKVVDGEDEQ